MAHLQIAAETPFYHISALSVATVKPRPQDFFLRFRRSLSSSQHRSEPAVSFAQTSPLQWKKNVLHFDISDRRNSNPKYENDRLVNLGMSKLSVSNPPQYVNILSLALRIISSHLPKIFINPLPPEILSDNITLHFFPSTHPHLPVVKGKIPYKAALWTAPVAWGSVPIIGNVQIQVLRERMVHEPHHSSTEIQHDDLLNGQEKLIVCWKTKYRSMIPKKMDGDAGTGFDRSHSSQEANRGLSVLLGGDAPIFKLAKEEQFTGLFIFTFDNRGKILKHTIEHAEKNSGHEKTPTVVSITDWLLRKSRLRPHPGNSPMPAFNPQTTGGRSVPVLCKSITYTRSNQPLPR